MIAHFASICVLSFV